MRPPSRERPRPELAAVIILLVVSVNLAACTSEERPPVSVLLISLDTTRADRIGAYGYQGIETPSLDRLAREGALFEDAIAPAPLTLPSHATLLSGIDPPGHGVHDNGSRRLEGGFTHIAGLFKQHGYTTAAFVSAYVLDAQFGLDNGFDLYDDALAGPGGGRGIPERSAEQTTDMALAWLEETLGAGAPFFCWLHLFAPHAPYHPPEPYRSRYLQDLYAGEIAYADAQIARAVHLLESSHHLDDTLIVVVGDHGEGLGDHDEETHGLFVYDANVRVPLILRGPGIPAGVKIGGVAALRDVAPTILESCRIAPPATMKGLSLVAALTDPGSLDDHAAYIESHFGERHYGWSRLVGLRTARFKYIRAPRPELYDLKRDPHETTSIAVASRALASQFDARLDELIDSSRRQLAGADGGEITGEMRRQLGRLGYATGSASRPRGPARDPKDCAETFKRLTRLVAYAEQGRTAEQIAEARLILREDPDNPVALEQLGLGLASVGRYAEALPSLTKALELGLDSATVRLQLGLAWLDAKRPDDAERHLEKAASIDPTMATVHQVLGMLHETRGDRRRAIEDYRKYLSLYKGDPRGALPVRNRLNRLLGMGQVREDDR